MAQDASLNGLRNQILTSVFGRRLGFDSAGYLLGYQGTRAPVQSLTSGTTATTVTFGGIALISLVTNASTWSLAAPVPGAWMMLENNSTGTGGVVKLASGNFVTTAGSTTTQVTVGGVGSAITIVGVTTAQAAVLTNWPQFPTTAASTSFIGASTFV